MTILPRPVGYHILVKIPKIAEKTAGGIIVPETTRSKEEVASTVVEVISMGPQCYEGTTSSGQTRFPFGAWCKVGDFIVLKSYAGTRIKVDGDEYRIITDDTPLAVVDDPASVERGQ